MFDGMLKSKFDCKCKSDVKLTRARADLVKKKRNAMQKYCSVSILAEGLLVEMNLTSCYEFVDQCCEHISKNVSAMDKQKECPEECREAVSSLMFAAARFADMPELRELRTLFSERYGNSLDCFKINKDKENFSEKMRSCLPSKESKLELLQEIAAESGLDWDSKALENKLFNESAYNKV
ncbi:regulator of Vps4 activity in the MVB pathway protein [Striga asiatica]|uniref:Regulator of Vps4 activity in the MVB pathway protein n=1 Tax=Striga asiatica TaxID=4170 RepID=A0A5A7QFF8_STRAF|nr:regulator of Vps4 activity in the MVB pathway protein [Striga asiatica]